MSNTPRSRIFFASHFCLENHCVKSIRTLAGYPKPAKRKIRTLTYVQYATVAGGSAASFEGALPLTKIGFANTSIPTEVKISII